LLFGKPKVLRVLDSALTQPSADKVSVERLRWALLRNGIKVRRVDYTSNNWASVTLDIDEASLQKLAMTQRTR
jgi:hypothetical protein